MNDMGELAAPTVYNGVMYVINGKWTFAIDVRDRPTDLAHAGGVRSRGAARRDLRRDQPRRAGDLQRQAVSRHDRQPPARARHEDRQASCGTRNSPTIKDGYYATGAPIVANGVLISGMAGGEFTTRGFLDGWDPETGKKLWRRYTIPAPGEPGSETWPKDSDAWMQGGGPTWRSGSYDPQLDLVYWGTGNAEPYDPRPRGALDSLYTSSVLAIRPKTGEIACYFQYTPNDVYDVDGIDEHVLADIRVDGQTAQGDDPGEQERLSLCAGSHQLHADRRASRTRR